MSLRTHFFLFVFVALLLSLSLLAAVACRQARASVENEMHMALEAGDHVVDNALLSLPGEGVDAYLERLVQSFDGNRHLRVTLRQGARVLAASHPAPADPVPAWYQRLLEIPTDQRLDTASHLDGRILLVETDAHNEIGEAWAQFRDGAAALALFSLLVLGLLYLAAARIAAPLKRLTGGFEAVGGGHYDVEVPAQGPRETARLAAGFNRMTARLRALEDSNRRLTGQMLAIQEEERADLARDLHDEMGPFLFAMRLDADAIRAQAATPQLVERAAALGEAVVHVQARVRAILQQLRPEGLAETGLATAIANLARFWQRHHAEVAIHLDVSRAGFGDEIDAVLFRLVQESLTNAVRHGGARQVWITITAGGHGVVACVEDDGVGLPDSPRGGMGIKGMRERLEALSGRLTLGARDGGGTRLVAEIPLVGAQ